MKVINIIYSYSNVKKAICIKKQSFNYYSILFIKNAKCHNLQSFARIDVTETFIDKCYFIDSKFLGYNTNLSKNQFKKLCHQFKRQSKLKVFK